MKTSEIETDRDLRIWCVEQCFDYNGTCDLDRVKELYAFVSTTPEESKVAQKKPRVCFFSRLCLKIQNWLK